MKPSDKRNNERKLSERLEKYGVDYEEKLSKSKKRGIESRKDKKMYAEHDKLNRKSMHVKTRNDVLVDQLKEKVCGIIFENKDEEFLETEEIRKEIGEEFALDIRRRRIIRV